MKISAWAITDPGNVRDNNEDSYLVDELNGLFIVADGVGGGDDGEVASKMLVDKLGENAERLSELAKQKDSGEDREHRESVFEQMSDVVHEINQAVYELGVDAGSTRPMATTCDAVLVVDTTAFIAHVGDSRVYLIRDGEIYRITEDHTFAEQLRERNFADEKVIERYKHVLSRSIGGQPQVEVDQVFVDLQDDDRLLICSDGLTDYLGGQEILEFASNLDASALLHRLVDEAKERGGADNITAVLVSVRRADDTIQDVGRFDTIQQVDLLGNVDIFRGMDIRDLLRLMRVVDRVKFKAGDVILKEHASFDRMYVVVQGSIELLVGDVVVNRVREGQHFGELALVTGDLCPFTARAMSDVRLLTFEDHRFRSLIADDRELGSKLLWNLLKASAREIGRLSTELSSRR